MTRTTRSVLAVAALDTLAGCSAARAPATGGTDLVRAIKGGQSRDGRPLVPIMPWPSYATLNDADTRAPVAYLCSMPPVHFAPPRRTGPGQKPPAPDLTVVVP